MPSTFAGQAASLHTTYHLLQILIHRSFIMIPRGVLRSGNPCPQYWNDPERRKLSDTALSVCVGSAKACAYILESQMQRGMSNINNVIHTAFVCCGILLVHWWGSVAKGCVGNAAKDLHHRQDDSYLQETKDSLHKFLNMLDTVSSRWTAAAMIRYDLHYGFFHGRYPHRVSHLVTKLWHPCPTDQFHVLQTADLRLQMIHILPHLLEHSSPKSIASIVHLVLLQCCRCTYRPSRNGYLQWTVPLDRGKTRLSRATTPRLRMILRPPTPTTTCIPHGAWYPI